MNLIIERLLFALFEQDCSNFVMVTMKELVDETIHKWKTTQNSFNLEHGLAKHSWLPHVEELYASDEELSDLIKTCRIEHENFRIDEAGRGCVLGDSVVGAYCCTKSSL